MVIKVEILNRKANFDYAIEDTYEAGIALKGTEVKSIRNGKANIKDSYAIVRNDEMFLLNTHISLYEEGNNFNHEETRTRKLLLHKKEILKLKNKVEMEGYTLIPLKIYFVKQRVKVLIGLAKGKKNYDKRETIKKRDVEREMRKTMKYS
jgi:SsrA-binding protein